MNTTGRNNKIEGGIRIWGTYTTMDSQEPVAGPSRACTRSMSRKHLKLQTNQQINRGSGEDERQSESAKLQMFQGTIMPFDLMTEDVWNLILKRVTSLDRLSLCRTNSQLDTAFGTNKYEWLLDQVLPYLLTSIGSYSLDLELHLLRMREVCKTWRNTIDTFLESELPSRRPYSRDHPLEKLMCRRSSSSSYLIFLCVDFNQITPSNLIKCLNFSISVKTLVTRSISIEIDDRWNASQVKQFTTEIMSFLKAHGNKLWHLKIEITNEALPCSVLWPLLVEYLQELPNLRTLSLMCSDGSEMGNFDVDMDAVTDLLIKDHPLPNLPNLNCLFLTLPCTLPNHFVDKYGSQINRLETLYEGSNTVIPNSVVDLELGVVGLFSDFKLRLTNLERLVLNLSVIFDTSIEEEHLNQILRQLPKLTNFKLNLDVGQVKYVLAKRRNLSFREILSVEVFELETNSAKIFSFCSLLLLFPNLKYVHFRLRDDWLPGSSRRLRQKEKVDKRVEIERYSDENKVEESPIWKTFENLKIFSFKDEQRNFGRFCTREQVDWYHREKRERKREYSLNKTVDNLLQC